MTKDWNTQGNTHEELRQMERETYVKTHPRTENREGLLMPGQKPKDELRGFYTGLGGAPS